MTRSSISLALKIASLIEDYSDQEIRNAVGLLRKYGKGQELLFYLSGERGLEASYGSLPLRGSRTKSLDAITSLAVKKIKESEPQKYAILSKFDSMVRQGQFFSTHEDLRKFCAGIDKNFKPRKSRKETISALMSVLADRSLSEIESVIEAASEVDANGNADEYQKLARFLIKGKGLE